MAYENTHSTIASKNYAAFALSLQEMYQNINRDTMSSAGYTAQAKEIQQLMAQVQSLNKTVQDLTKRPATATDKDSKQQKPAGKQARGNNKANKRQWEHGNNKQQQKKGKGARFCDTCDFNHTHWSNLCNRPKEDHDEDRMAP
jgi:hypothetical protein